MSRKKTRKLGLVLAFAILFTGAVPFGGRAFAEEAETETETETEDPYPETYYYPIESNEVEGWPAGPQIEAGAAAVMDVDTGALLYSKNATAKEYPASVTKVMTCLVALEHIEDLDATITFSEVVYQIDADSSHSGIKPGEEMTVRDALYCLMLASANDAAMGIAEYCAGSVDMFVGWMNEKAAELGCVNTHFTNPHGLHDENHYTCAADMARISRAAYKNTEFRRIAGTIYYEIAPTNETEETRYLTNHQKMLYQEDVFYEYCVGGKTGFTDEALNTLVTYAKKDKRTLVSVVLYLNGAVKTYTESAQLLDYGFDDFKRLRVQIPEYSETVGQLAGARMLSSLSVTYDESLSTPAVQKKSSTVLDVPASIESGDVEKTVGGGRMYFTYSGWDLGSIQLKLNSPAVAVGQPALSDATAQTLAAIASGEIETPETEEPIPEDETIPQMLLRLGRKYMRKAKKLAEEGIDWLKENAPAAGAWVREKAGAFEGWVMENDLAAALLVLVLILFLIPILIVAWIRNSKAKKIRKARRQEKEERVRIEKDIDAKPVSEIEAELRAELEKDRLRREREAANEKEAAVLAEAERLVDEQEAIREASMPEAGEAADADADGDTEEKTE